ncbi:M23 family metallopeptidase [Kiloniella laminariae]|uniref:M23 family metallopeptidase n=1 Tax=Kiloniella laminariae TaxID=454162 RepID=A0ABT4LNB8_9PROT|nr:M23 family metallopeptidase [Kiloniella laminariae]MCZ4282623.1 M23 family metallopeptidase [Kiloniella laminariae]
MSKKSVPIPVQLSVFFLSVALAGCGLVPSSFPNLSNPPAPKVRTDTIYAYPPTLPKRKPTPPPRPSTSTQNLIAPEPYQPQSVPVEGTVAGSVIPALLPSNIPYPRRNPRRSQQGLDTASQQTVSPSSEQDDQVNAEENRYQALTTGEYRVARGDTVYSISRTKGVSIRELILLNDLSAPYILKVGQVMRLPVSNDHVVVAGDTLYSVSRKYGVDTTELVRLNQIQPPYALLVGQRLSLPAAQPGANTTATTTPQTAAVQPAPAQPRIQNQTGPIPQPPPRSASTFLLPVKGKVISGFGPKEGGIHNDGINISAQKGTPVMAAENGVVVYAGSELKGFGQMLLIKHSGGWVTAYAHADQLLVGRGQKVSRGQEIARVGSTGNVSQPQLHFEIRKGSEAVNPEKLVVN